MGKPGVKPLSTERRPASLAPRIPDGSTPHRVSDGEDWRSLEVLYGISSKDLMLFNFNTTIPANVNWYLREYVGCDLPDGPRNNWKFSTSADPGFVYIPTTFYNMYDLDDPDDSTVIIAGKPPSKVKWGASLNYPSGSPHGKILALEIGHLVIAALEGVGAHFALLSVGVVVAPFAAEAAVLAAIGGAHVDAMAIRAKSHMRDGYAIGVVLGANGAKPNYVKAHYMQHHTVGIPVRDTRPDYARGKRTSSEKLNVFNLALAAGYADGRSLNLPQVHQLFNILHSKIPGDVIPRKGEWKTWNDIQKRKYYNELSFAFKKLFIKG